MTVKNGFRIVMTVLTLAAVLAVLAPLFLSRTPWPEEARNHLEARGVDETGAANLVSAIYLGYRAFDTLGEAIVLFTAITGTIAILSRSGASLAPGFNQDGPGGTAFSISEDKKTSLVLRTHLLEVVTGKIGPIVLLFGGYLMLYGHLSPGGGFQGGVVTASGIVFIAIGSRSDATTRFTRASVLNRIEALGFLLLIAAAISGMAAGKGVLGDPLGSGYPRSPGFIIILNILIGVKVGAGIGFMGIAMTGRNLS